MDTVLLHWICVPCRPSVMEHLVQERAIMHQCCAFGSLAAPILVPKSCEEDSTLLEKPFRQREMPVPRSRRVLQYTHAFALETRLKPAQSVEQHNIGFLDSLSLCALQISQSHGMRFAPQSLRPRYPAFVRKPNWPTTGPGARAAVGRPMLPLRFWSFALLFQLKPGTGFMEVLNWVPLPVERRLHFYSLANHRCAKWCSGPTERLLKRKFTAWNFACASIASPVSEQRLQGTGFEATPARAHKLHPCGSVQPRCFRPTQSLEFVCYCRTTSTTRRISAEDVLTDPSAQV